MKMRFLKVSFFSLIVMMVSQAAHASPCLVTTEKADYSETLSLPYLIEKTTYNRGSGGCWMNSSYADKATADQYVAFQTAETEPSDTSDIVGTIVLKAMSSESTTRGQEATLYFKPLDPMIVGNPSEAAINGENEATYDPDSSGYILEDGEIKDYGFVVIDGRTNFAKKSDGDESTDNLPLKCVEGSSDVFLRNLIIVTNGYSKTDLLDDSTALTSCFKDGGNLHVCSGTYKENSDPNTDSDWCDEDSTFTGPHILPGGGIIDLFDCDEEDKITWYDDDDSDGFGDASDSKKVCPDTTPSGYVQDDSDCDDTSAAINPDEDEVCDEIDNNCDELIDDEELGDGVCTVVTTSEVCTDTIDNDGDGLIDCADEEDCDSDATCFSAEEDEICDDGIDNDSDGFADCTDDECDTTVTCNGVGPEEECSDGIDNDEDLATDCDDDDCTDEVDCGAVVTTETLCEDTLDDDSDGNIDCDDSDCENDAACVVPVTTETECSDGLDDDSDTFFDCDDGDCTFATECVNASENDCTDGLDDDDDGLADCDDEDCADVVVSGDLTCADLDINPADPADDMAGGGCGCNLTAKKTPVMQNVLLALLGIMPLMVSVVLRLRTSVLRRRES